jgi:hypothetical protein
MCLLILFIIASYFVDFTRMLINDNLQRKDLGLVFVSYHFGSGTLDNRGYQID